MNYRTLIKEVNSLRPSECIYMNAINFSINSIETVRKMVKNGVLIPDIEEVKKAYKDVDAVMTGKVVFPQMTYIKGGKDFQSYMV